MAQAIITYSREKMHPRWSLDGFIKAITDMDIQVNVIPTKHLIYDVSDNAPMQMEIAKATIVCTADSFDIIDYVNWQLTDEQPSESELMRRKMRYGWEPTK